jgi:hypothetical protein
MLVGGNVACWAPGVTILFIVLVPYGCDRLLPDGIGDVGLARISFLGVFIGIVMFVGGIGALVVGAVGRAAERGRAALGGQNQAVEDKKCKKPPPTSEQQN